VPTRMHRKTAKFERRYRFARVGKTTRAHPTKLFANAS
jgi:hypothetical protein